MLLSRSCRVQRKTDKIKESLRSQQASRIIGLLRRQIGTGWLSISLQFLQDCWKFFWRTVVCAICLVVDITFTYMDGPFGVINRYVQIYCLLSLYTEVLLTTERADNKMPQYLLPQDFYNARFVSPSNPIRGEKIRNDQRFISRVRLKLCEILIQIKLSAISTWIRCCSRGWQMARRENTLCSFFC